MKKMIAALALGFTALGSGCATMDGQLIASVVDSVAGAYDSRNKLKAAKGEQRLTEKIYERAYRTQNYNQQAPRRCMPTPYGPQCM